MDVVLIGPIAAGKSTLGNLLSAAPGLPRGSVDEHTMTDGRWTVSFAAGEFSNGMWDFFQAAV